MKKQLLLIFMFAVLSCFAGNTKKTKIACIGDSITYGMLIKDRATNCYPYVLQQLLGNKFDVQNFGNSGRGILQRSMRGREKRAYIFMKEHKQALAFQPNIVICNLGINDIGDWEKIIPESTAKFNSEFVEQYKELIQSYRTLPTTPIVFLWTPLAPLFKGQPFFNNKNLKVIDSEIKKVAAELNKIKTATINGKKVKLAPVYIIDMNKPLAGKDSLFPDKIHPNAEGAKIIAEETHKALKKNLKSLVK